jgi:hypothetical protein
MASGPNVLGAHFRSPSLAIGFLTGFELRPPLLRNCAYSETMLQAVFVKFAGKMKKSDQKLQ